VRALGVQQHAVPPSPPSPTFLLLVVPDPVPGSGGDIGGAAQGLEGRQCARPHPRQAAGQALLGGREALELLGSGGGLH
jgi:hypothetical protein